MLPIPTYTLKPAAKVQTPRPISEEDLEAGVRAAVHLDGEVRGLLPRLAEVGFDAVESITPAPVTATAGSYNGTYDGVAHSPECLITGDYTGDLTCTNNPNSLFNAASAPSAAASMALSAACSFSSTPTVWPLISSNEAYLHHNHGLGARTADHIRKASQAGYGDLLKIHLIPPYLLA